jgi:hypothetical protein
MRFGSLVVLAAGLIVSGCTCKPDVQKVTPSIGVSPPGLDFGQVKVGQSKTLTVRLEAQTRTAVNVSGITIEGAAAAAYRLGTTPTQIESLGNGMFSVTFTPPAVAAFAASLVIKSDDPDRATVRVAMAGEGAMPKIELTPDCKAAQGCTATVLVTPPSIDFGLEPLSRPVPLDPTRLPTLIIVNAGDVELDVQSVALTGADADAFSFAGGSVGDGGVKLGASEGFNLPIRFVPTDAAQPSYSANVVVTSDDPDAPSITIPLTGALKPNEPPVLCANLIRVTPPPEVGEAPRDYSSAAQWAMQIPAPAGGYDFRASRDVRPRDLVVLSALSDAADATKCSTDPEDGRTGLTFQWRLVSGPPGTSGLAISGAATAQAQLRPIITGDYTLELRVTDRAQAQVTTTVRFSVAVKQDLVVQLEWPGFSGVDLDLHLVRPTSITGTDAFTGAFSFFNSGTSGKTSGDINGYARRERDSNAGAGFDFDWGMGGDLDNPTLNVDDIGDGELVENISLNYPENDAECATASCSYAVLVHYFADARTSAAPSCIVDGGVGCADGEQCFCAASFRCVAESAPAGSSPAGSGKCYAAPTPVLKLFFKGSPTPANVIPLDTLMPVDEVPLGAPCTMWHVADIAWPARTAIGSLPDGGTPPPVVTVIGADAGTPRVANPSFSRFGLRPSGGSLRCTGDSMQGAINWYAQQPR